MCLGSSVVIVNAIHVSHALQPVQSAFPASSRRYILCHLLGRSFIERQSSSQLTSPSVVEPAFQYSLCLLGELGPQGYDERACSCFDFEIESAVW